jgi:hypothetical protein
MLKQAEPAATHKFRIGQKVDLIPQWLGQCMLNGPFVVTEQFRHQGELLYCVKSSFEPYERVLKESRLCAVKCVRGGHDASLSSPFVMEVQRNPR